MTLHGTLWYIHTSKHVIHWKKQFMMTSPDVTPSTGLRILTHRQTWHRFMGSRDKTRWIKISVMPSNYSNVYSIWGDCDRLSKAAHAPDYASCLGVPWLYHQHSAGKFCGYTSSTRGRPNRRVIQSAAGLKISLLRIAPSFVRSST